MRIAFVSYEAPPDNVHGGIATYISQATKMLAARGHDVEVFTRGRDTSDTQHLHGVTIHRLHSSSFSEFAAALPGVFGRHHANRRFDLVEAPEFQAEYRPVAERFPDLPVVVKLHTPTFMIRRLMTEGWRYEQPRWRRRLWRLQNQYRIGVERAPLDDVERESLRYATAIAAPCRAIRDLVVSEWHLESQKIAVVPLPFQPDHGLLDVPVGSAGPVVMFVGRVEVRKGVVDLVEAFPLVRRRHPDAELWFVGADGEAPDGTASMTAYLERRLAGETKGVRFVGRVPRERLPEMLGHAAVVALPSLWENFPLACLEAMAAGRAAVVTAGTGMEEMADYGRAAVVVPPRDRVQLARAIVRLLDDRSGREAMGARARARVRETYSWDTIGALQESHYQHAVTAGAGRNGRS